MREDHLKEYMEFLEKTKGLSECTLKHYKYFIKDFDMEKISQDYINEYIQTRGNNSIVRGAVLNLFEMLSLHKLYDMPPKMTGRTKKRIVRDVTGEEISHMREYLYRHSFKRGVIFDLLYQGALRRVEVPTIKLNSFKWIDWLDDMSKPCHLIILGKGDKERVVLINPETAELIFSNYCKKYNINSMERIMEFANSPNLLFTREDGSAISMWYVWKVIRLGSKNVLGRSVRTHELRHARATELERMGVQIKDIKNYLGHSSLATTEIYLHTTEKESIENIEKIMLK
jgi:integrase/recombinase XerD